MEIIHASKRGKLEKVIKLLDSGVNVNIQNKCGETALILASFRGHFEVVKNLLEYDASSTLRTNHSSKARSMINVNIQNNNGDTALILASLTGQLEVIKILLQHGANINIQNYWGNTALIKTSITGQVKVIKILLEYGADINIKNKYGNTALIIASEYGHLEVVKLLEKKELLNNLLIVQKDKDCRFHYLPSELLVYIAN